MAEYDVYKVEHEIGTFLPVQITREYIERNGSWFHKELLSAWQLSIAPLSRIDAKRVSTPVGIAEHAGRVEVSDQDLGAAF